MYLLQKMLWGLASNNLALRKLMESIIDVGDLK